MAAANKQLYLWSWTLFSDKDNDHIIGELQVCDKWVFQLEACPTTGRPHYQGHLHLKDKKRRTELIAFFGAGEMSRAIFSVTSNALGAQFYCLKEESKIDGPWSDDKSKCDLRIEVPWDLLAIKEWYAWQLDFFEKLKMKEDRYVNVIIDGGGNKGKSKALKWALWKKWAGIIPCIGDAKDIIQACCSMGPKDAYILDLPRTGEGDKHLASQIKAIEQIKNGIVLDFRYKYTECIFGSPQIWVFTNHEIDGGMLSADRWIKWCIKDNQLKRRL